MEMYSEVESEVDILMEVCAESQCRSWDTAAPVFQGIASQHVYGVNTSARRQ
jgi:hypothetical protein